MTRFAGTLAVLLGVLAPAGLAVGGVWMTDSSWRANLVAEERERAERALAATAARCIAVLQENARVPAAGIVTITLDERGRPSGPFLPWVARPEREDDRVEVEVAAARLLADQGRLGEARARLSTARLATPPLVSAPLAFPLIADLLEASLCAEHGDREPARRLRDALLRGAVPLPAAATTPVLALVAELVGEAHAPSEDALSGAAAFATLLGDQHVPLPTAPTTAPNGAFVIPSPEGLHVVVAELASQWLAQTMSAPDPTFRFALDAAPDDVAHRGIPGLPLTLHARYQVTRTSDRLLAVGRTLYGLAVAAFLIGIALAWRLARRERALVAQRAEFVDLVSHELRTPLQALALKTEMLAEGLVPDGRVAEYSRDAHAEVLRLSDLVQRVLEFSRLTRRERAAPRHELAVRALLARCLRETRHECAARQQRVVVTASRALGTLHADGELLACAVRNLIQNAAKFSPHGAEITLSAEREAGTVRIRVADRGPGVPNAERERVFAPFERGAGAQKFSGTGLGLAIVAGTARLHQGTVTVEERVGGGAVFTLSLPVSA